MALQSSSLDDKRPVSRGNDVPKKHCVNRTAKDRYTIIAFDKKLLSPAARLDYSGAIDHGSKNKSLQKFLLHTQILLQSECKRQRQNLPKTHG